MFLVFFFTNSSQLSKLGGIFFFFPKGGLQKKFNSMRTKSFVFFFSMRGEKGMWERGKKKKVVFKIGFILFALLVLGKRICFSKGPQGVFLFLPCGPPQKKKKFFFLGYREFFSLGLENLLVGSFWFRFSCW